LLVQELLVPLVPPLALHKEALLRRKELVLLDTPHTLRMP